MSKMTEKIAETKNKVVEGVKKHKGAILGGAAAVATGVAAIVVAKVGLGGGEDFVEEYDYEEDDCYYPAEDGESGTDDASEEENE